MMNIRASGVVVFVVLGLMFSDAALAKGSRPSDNQIKEEIIADSIAGYDGNCPCPYNRARNGSSCGKRSAWSRAGGEAPLCYKDDVSQEMVDEWRAAHH